MLFAYFYYEVEFFDRDQTIEKNYNVTVYIKKTKTLYSSFKKKEKKIVKTCDELVTCY